MNFLREEKKLFLLCEKQKWLKELKLQGLKHAVNEMDFSGICYWMRDIVIGCFYGDTWGKLDFTGVNSFLSF